MKVQLKARKRLPKLPRLMDKAFWLVLLSHVTHKSRLFIHVEYAGSSRMGYLPGCRNTSTVSTLGYMHTTNTEGSNILPRRFRNDRRIAQHIGISLVSKFIPLSPNVIFPLPTARCVPRRHRFPESVVAVQVTILVSLLTSPVLSLIFGVFNRGPGDTVVRSMLWSQAFIVLTAVSLAWSIHGVITLRKVLVEDAAAAADPTGAAAAAAAAEDTTNNAHTAAGINGPDHQRAQALATKLSPEACIIKAAEAVLSGSPHSVADEDAALAALATTAAQARSRGLTIDTPVLQTEKSLRAWSKVISHQGEVERDIRETHRWGVLGEKLLSMNGGMPFMVGIIQVCCILFVSCATSTRFVASGDFNR